MTWESSFLCAMTLTIATLNIRGITRPEKQNEVIEMVKQKGVDILLLQETYVRMWPQIRKFDRTYKTMSFWSFGSKGSAGTAIIIMPKCKTRVVKHERDSEGRILSVDLDIGIRIICIYAPNKAKDQVPFFEELDTRMIGAARVILAGDFNCVIDIRNDRTGKQLKKITTGGKALERLTGDINLVDAWRIKNVGASGMTWTGRGLQTRIDRFYVSQAIVEDYISIKTHEHPLSDHKMGVLKIKAEVHAPWGKGEWRLNPRLLQDERVKEKIREHIRRAFEDGIDGKKWDTMKVEIKEDLHRIGEAKAKQERRELEIVGDALILLRTVATGPGKAEALLTLRKIYTNILKKRWRITQAQARAETWEREHWCSRHLLQQYLSKPFVHLTEAIHPSSKQKVSSKEEVLEAVYVFYKELYTKKPCNPTAIEVTIAQDTDTGFDIEPFTKEEVKKSILDYKKNKSPGPDGIPGEFYEVFQEEMIPVLTVLYNDGMQNLLFPHSFVQSTITLLCKDEGKKEDLKAWRPIALLNQDYKTFAKCLAKRIAPHLASIVSETQACCIKERSTVLQGMALRDFLLWADSRQQKGIMCSIDQEKAFDQIDHRYLWYVLERYGIPEVYVNILKVLYNRCEAKVKVNGATTDIFYIERGVRQGCPLSPMLYVIGIDPLIRNIGRNPGIKRLVPPGGPTMVPTFAYADDLTIVVGKETDLQAVSSDLSAFCEASGARVNKNKSAVLYFGGLKPEATTPAGFPIVKEMKILGWYFDPNHVSQKNWRVAMEKLKLKIKAYERLQTSLIARANMIRSLVFSQLLYPATILQVPVEVNKTVEKLIFRFLWEGKPDKVARIKVKQSREKGGLCVPDLHQAATALHFQWTAKALRSDMPLTASLAHFNIGFKAKDFGLQTSLTTPKAGVRPKIYKEVCETLHHVQKTADKDLTKMGMQDIIETLQEAETTKHGIQPNWSLITAEFMDTNKASFTWKFAHGALPKLVHQMKKKKDMHKCPICQQEETFRHMFQECRYTSEVLKRIAHLFNIQVPTYEEIRFLTPVTVPKNVIHQYVQIITEYTYQTWKIRCKWAHQGKIEPATALMQKINAETSWMLRREKGRLTSKDYKRAWCSPPVIHRNEKGCL